MAADRASLPHVRALDGLRGLALCAILLYHSDYLIGGFLSVDMFFALSGFLITSLLLVEWRNTGKIGLAHFWSRRARRLLPALGFLLVGIAGYALVFAAPTELTRIRSDALATIAYVANWHAIFTHQSYFDQFGTASPLRHAWTLAVEEQFYLIWPLAMFGIVGFCKRRTPIVVLVTAIVMAAASAITMALFYTQADPNRAYYGTDTRAYAVFAGIAIAAIVAEWGHVASRNGRAVLEAAAFVGVAVIAVMWNRFEAQSPEMYHGGFLVGAIALAVLLLAATNPRRGPINHALSFRGFVWLGTISYGVYLWHWPINLVLDRERTGIDGWPLFAVRTAIALAFGLLSYVLVEEPVRRGAGSARQWKVLTPVALAGLMILLLATTAATERSTDIAGLNREDALRGNTVAAMRHRRTLVGEIVPPSVPRVLVVGDSVSLTLALGAPIAPTRPFAVTSATMLGCGLARGIPLGLVRYSPESACVQWPKIWRRGIKVFHPRALVLLTGGWEVLDRQIDGRILPSQSAALGRHLRERLELAASIADRAGIPLVVLTTPCFTPPSTGLGADLAPLGEPRRIAWFNALMAKFAANHPTSVRTIDLGGFVCPKGRARDTIDGVQLRSDGIHFTLEGAERVWRWLTPRLQALIPSEPISGS